MPMGGLGEEMWLDDDGSGSMAPSPSPRPDFRTTDWVIASGTTVIVAVCICAGIISLRPYVLPHYRSLSAAIARRTG